MMRMMVKAPITCIGAVALIIMQTPRQAPVLIVILIIVGFLILGNVKIGYPAAPAAAMQSIISP